MTLELSTIWIAPFAAGFMEEILIFNKWQNGFQFVLPPYVRYHHIKD